MKTNAKILADALSAALTHAQFDNEQTARRFKDATDAVLARMVEPAQTLGEATDRVYCGDDR